MWQTPKTTWKAEDYFNIGDYNRIKGNLSELREMALTLYPDFTWESMGTDKTYTDYSFYADEINRFEVNLDHLCAGTYPFAVGSKKTFADNRPFIGWKELNRLERACLLIYNNLTGQATGRARLAVVPGRRRLPRC